MAAWWPDSSTSRHCAALPLRRPGVVRVFQQPGAETLLLGAGRRAHHAGQQPHAGVQQHQRRQLAAGQHVVADADLLSAARVDHALVDALVAPAQQPHAGPGGQVARTRACVERRAARREVERAADRHPRPIAASSTSGRITMPAPPPNGVSSTVRCRSDGSFADVDGLERPPPRFERPAGQRLPERPREHRREQGQDGGAPGHADAPPRSPLPPGEGWARVVRPRRGSACAAALTRALPGERELHFGRRHDDEPPRRRIHLRHRRPRERHQQRRRPPRTISRLAPAP